ncbi:MAG TPA: ABC transporter permease [Jiangellales bacterium]|nr:ABC transporter permease [Jiangellales bacterium]
MSALAHTGGAGMGGGTGPPEAAPSGTVGRSRWTPYLLLFPGLAWLTVFFVIPSVTLFSTSLQSGTVETGYALTFEVSNYLDAWSTYWPQLLRSFVYAGLATVLALVIAYPLAYAIAFKAGRWRYIMLILVIAPFYTSFLIRTLAWRTILADNGVVVEVLNALYITDLLSFVGLTEGDRVLATPLAVITGLTYNFLPFMTLPLYAALDRLDPRLVEAASDLYASPFTAFRKVTWPLSLPGVVAGTLLTFIPASGDYINAQLLGSLPATAMIGNVIDTQFLRVLDYPTAAALSFTLMVTVVAMVALYVRRAGTEELV